MYNTDLENYKAEKNSVKCEMKDGRGTEKDIDFPARYVVRSGFCHSVQ